MLVWILVGALSSACITGAEERGGPAEPLTEASGLRTEVGSHVLVEADVPLYRDVQRQTVAFRTADPTTMRIMAAGNKWVRLRTKPLSGSHCFGELSGLESVDLTVYARPGDLARVNREPTEIEIDEDATVIVRPGARLTSTDGGWTVHAREISLETEEIRSVGTRYDPAPRPLSPNSRLIDGRSLPDSLDGLEGMPSVTGGLEFAHSFETPKRLDLYDGCVVVRLTGDRLERVRPPRLVGRSGSGGVGGMRTIPPETSLYWKDGRHAGETTHSLTLRPRDLDGESSQLVCTRFHLHEKPTTRTTRSPRHHLGSTVLRSELISRDDDETQPTTDESRTESMHLCFFLEPDG